MQIDEFWGTDRISLFLMPKLSRSGGSHPLLLPWRTNDISWILRQNWAGMVIPTKFYSGEASSSLLFTQTGRKHTVAPFCCKWMDFDEITTFLGTSCKTSKGGSSRATPWQSGLLIQPFDQRRPETRGGPFLMRMDGFWRNNHISLILMQNRTRGAVPMHFYGRKGSSFFLFTKTGRSTRLLLFHANGWILMNWPHLLNPRARLSKNGSCHRFLQQRRLFVLTFLTNRPETHGGSFLPCKWMDYKEVKTWLGSSLVTDQVR